nr:RNA-directed DNA polymerase, eukaryota [Tanacetum cinerariifolium]
MEAMEGIYSPYASKLYNIAYSSPCRSKEDDVMKISTSIYVTNLPERFGAKDLRNTCQSYGHVVDTFIPDRRSKAGKRFGFVRFIKIIDVDRLYKQSSKAYEYGKYSAKSESGNNSDGTKTKINSFAQVVRGVQSQTASQNNFPTMVLDESCLNKEDITLRLLGKVKEFASLPNLKMVLAKEGYTSLDLKYMGGLWVMIKFQEEETINKFHTSLSTGSWFSQIIQANYDFDVEERVMWIDVEGVPWKWWSRNTFNRIASRWSSLLNGEELEDGDFHSNRLCICLKMKTIVSESFKMASRGKIYWVRAIEVSGWVPDFEDDSDEMSYDSLNDDKELGVRREFKKRWTVKAVWRKYQIHVLMNLKYPPGFTPNGEGDGSGADSGNQVDENSMNVEQAIDMNVEKQDNVKDRFQRDTNESNCPGHFKKSTTPRTGGYILHLIDDLVKVGQTMGFDMSGVAQTAKKDWVKELCVSYKVNFVTLQETKMEKIDLWCIKRCWGNLSFDYTYSEAVGNSGGILCILDPTMFQKENETISDYFVIVRGMWVPSDIKMIIISVYAPQEFKLKRMLWDYLCSVISNWDGNVVVMGNFNEVRDASERFGSIFNKKGAKVFNNFIINVGLVKLPLGGCSFTLCHKSAKKMSKLDRFLVSDNLVCTCPNLSSISLDRLLSDHRPILMRECHGDYGPTPFKFFHYWFEIDGFNKFVEESWKDNSVIDQNHFSKFMKKLKFFRMKIQKWISIYKERSKSGKRHLNSELRTIDSKIDRESPISVKKEFYDHFKNRFGNPSSSGIQLLVKEFFKRLSVEQNANLEGEVSNEEIKNAVWGCGIDKAPGPDGYTFGFYRRYSRFIKNDIVEAIKWFFANSTIPKGGYLVNEVQSAFVADRQILDGPFILNELVQWIKSKKKQTMVFKVDFEKAYDSVKWDFLDIVMKKFSPTQEFQFHKGLKQGDPLSSFLFILVMESLHTSFQRVVDIGLFKGVKLSPTLLMTHLFYADDAIFMGQWNQANIDTLIRVLDVFHRASELRINISKSKLLEIYVESSKLDQAAAKIGCAVLNTPFTYLGSRVGGNMSRIKAWNDIIEGMVSHLSKWKVKTLSIGGRLTLLKSVLGALPIYHMSIFKVHMKVLKNMEVIRAGFFNGTDINTKKPCWEVESLKDKGMDLLQFTSPVLGNGISTSFWEVPWRGDVAFKVLAPRIYALETMKNIVVTSNCVILSNSNDRWVWNLVGSGEFSVASVRKYIDDHSLPSESKKTIWIKEVPIKINILAWKVKNDGLPTRFNISRRGMEIDTITCPLCDVYAESTRHVFFSCKVFCEVMRNIARWCELEYNDTNSYEEWPDWLISIRLPLNLKKVFEGICYIVWWHIWNWRNKKIFGHEKHSFDSIFDEIVSRSIYWIHFRSKTSFSWMDWLKNPNLISL